MYSSKPLHLKSFNKYKSNLQKRLSEVLDSHGPQSAKFLVLKCYDLLQFPEKEAFRCYRDDNNPLSRASAAAVELQWAYFGGTGGDEAMLSDTFLKFVIKEAYTKTGLPPLGEASHEDCVKAVFKSVKAEDMPALFADAKEAILRHKLYRSEFEEAPALVHKEKGLCGEDACIRMVKLGSALLGSQVKRDSYGVASDATALFGIEMTLSDRSASAGAGAGRSPDGPSCDD